MDINRLKGIHFPLSIKIKITNWDELLERSKVRNGQEMREELRSQNGWTSL